MIAWATDSERQKAGRDAAMFRERKRWYRPFLRAKVRSVERVVQLSGSFEDAEVADDQFYADLTPEERLDILLELVERHRSFLGETAGRFERVHRIVELSRS